MFFRLKNPGPQKTNHRDLIKHETKQHVLMKFVLVFLVFLSYFLIVSLQYGVANGLAVTALTWSFFVMCTPVADAGFLLDFPLRLITQVRMFTSEIVVWGLAILINVYAFFLHPEFYEKTKLLMLFEHILEQPFPFWAIILVSGVGTFMSIQFGDELMDKVKHKQRKGYHEHKYKYRFWLMVFVVVLCVVLYDFLLKQLGVDLPL